MSVSVVEEAVIQWLDEETPPDGLFVRIRPQQRMPLAVLLPYTLSLCNTPSLTAVYESRIVQWGGQPVFISAL